MPPSPKGVVTDWVGFAKESGGLTTAAAAPAPSRRAKSRREIEMVFMESSIRLFAVKSRPNCVVWVANTGDVRYPNARLVLHCDPYAIETAQSTALANPAVPAKMADADSAPRCIFPEIVGERPRGTTWSHSSLSCRKTL